MLLLLFRLLVLLELFTEVLSELAVDADDVLLLLTLLEPPLLSLWPSAPRLSSMISAARIDTSASIVQLS